MRLPIAREGWPFIAVGALLLLLAFAWARGQDSGLRMIAPGVAAILLLFTVYFFRDPDRRVPEDPSLVLSPADGRVIEIRDVEGESFVGPVATRVSIFLNIFDVHVQRAPLAGTVGSYSYHPGGYAVAWHEKASEENERAALGIRTDRGPIVVRQIAGLVARRIVTYPREGDSLSAGERIGLIRFGSRVELLMPPDWPVAVSVGDRVVGGETVLASVRQDP